MRGCHLGGYATECVGHISARSHYLSTRGSAERHYGAAIDLVPDICRRILKRSAASDPSRIVVTIVRPSPEC